MEGLLTLAASMTFYGPLDGEWLRFCALFLVPDVGILPFLCGQPRLGRFTYNATHTYTVPLVLALSAQLIDVAVGVELAAIWMAHIGVDRMLGYGLKTGPRWSDTHLGRW